MTSYAEITDRFAQRGRPLRGRNVYANDKYIFSYGSHFPMAYADDERKLFIINGDTFSSSTSRHQSLVRGSISQSPWDSFIIPFSVLRTANVELETLEVIDRGKEIDEGGCRTCNLVWNFTNNDWSAHTQYREHEQEFGRNEKNIIIYGACEEHKFTLGNAHLDGSFNYNAKHYHRNPEYRPNPHDMYRRHLLAPSLVKGWRRVDVPIKDSPCAAYTCDKLESEHQRDLFFGHTYRPQLTTERRARYFLSGFDDTARAWGGGYFFSELPRKASTIEEAYQLLRPKPVREADQAGVEVKRQGDIFWIPTPDVTTRDLTPADNKRLLSTNHFATEVRIDKRGQVYARGILHHRPGGREADHRRIKLIDKIWGRVYRNTAVGSWSASRGSGRVD